jgi:peroxiredoxin
MHSLMIYALFILSLFLIPLQAQGNQLQAIKFQWENLEKELQLEKERNKKLERELLQFQERSRSLQALFLHSETTSLEVEEFSQTLSLNSSTSPWIRPLSSFELLMAQAFLEYRSQLKGGDGNSLKFSKKFLESAQKRYGRDFESMDHFCKYDSLASEFSLEEEILEEWLEGTPEQRERFKDFSLEEWPPELKLSLWQGSEPLDFSDFEGKVVLINFWAPWCQTCMLEVPKLNALHSKYKEQGLIVLGVCTTTTPKNLIEFSQKYKVEYPLAMDRKNRTAETYKVDGFHDYFIWDRLSRLRIPDCANEKIEEAICALLREKK